MSTLILNACQKKYVIYLTRSDCYADIAFKQKFYYAKGAHYETATLAEISLIPVEYIMDDVKSDYVAMKNMIYGEYPYFHDVIDCLRKLETEVHTLS